MGVLGPPLPSLARGGAGGGGRPGTAVPPAPGSLGGRSDAPSGAGQGCGPGLGPDQRAGARRVGRGGASSPDRGTVGVGACRRCGGSAGAESLALGGGRARHCRRAPRAADQPGESFQVLGPLCCAIEPWGHAASLAAGRDVTPGPCPQTLRREGGFWTRWVPGLSHLRPALPCARWAEEEGTVCRLEGRGKLHPEMLWSHCACDAGESSQLRVVTPRV